MSRFRLRGGHLLRQVLVSPFVCLTECHAGTTVSCLAEAPAW